MYTRISMSFDIIGRVTKRIRGVKVRIKTWHWGVHIAGEVPPSTESAELISRLNIFQPDAPGFQKSFCWTETVLDRDPAAPSGAELLLRPCKTLPRDRMQGVWGKYCTYTQEKCVIGWVHCVKSAKVWRRIFWVFSTQYSQMFGLLNLSFERYILRHKFKYY